MADIVIFTDTLTTATQDIGTTTNGIFFLGRNASLVNTLTTGVTGDGFAQTYIINGDLAAEQNGISITGLDAQANVSGTITANSNGIEITRENATIHVTGSVTGGGQGIAAREDGAKITVSQTGSVVGDSSGIRIGPSFTDSEPDVSNLSNAGTISGSLFGVGVNSNAFINNSGLITKTSDRDSSVGNGAITLFADRAKELVIHNSGDIISSPFDSDFERGIAIETRQSVGHVLDLLNTGNIIGDIKTALGIDKIINNGEIAGDITLNAGEDTIRNTGTINGDVDLGSDADTFNNAGFGVVAGTVLGGFGNDTITGGDGGDAFDGGDNDDHVIGRGGNDTLAGGAGEDTVLGGAGADNLRGDSNADVLNGQDGNDTLIGGSGDDRLLGGQGNDDITAGTGADIIRGGGGEDRFIFSDTTETGTGATRDRIIGFEDGVDLIDLTGFGAIEFSATGSAIGSGTASVWFQAVSGGAQTMLRIDVDGDGGFDGQVLLVRADPAQFDQSDLILA
ncbi:MAG: calcium-binding protein [Pseudomonadota bacterium]